MAPSISGLSGTLTHGSSVTISGSSFGSKGGTNANKPLIWADFETSINPTSLGHFTSWDGSQNLSRNVGGTQYTNSGANVVGTRSSGVYAFEFSVLHTMTTFYLSGKRRFSSVSSNNFKFFRVWNDAPSSFLAASINGGMCYDETHTTQDNRFQDHGLSANVWRMEEYHFKKSTSNSSSPVSGNGTYRYTVNGTVYQEHDEYMASNLTANYGQHLGLSVFDNFDTNEDLPNGTTIHMDDFYLDDTWARVMIGNASTLASCTVREMQIPSAWSDTSITVTLNRGSFGATDTAYVYVFDSTDAPSAGFSITFGDAGQSVTPASASLSTSFFAPTVTASSSPHASPSSVLLFVEWMAVAWAASGLYLGSL